MEQTQIPKNPQAIILSAFESGMVLTVKQAWRIAGTTELRRIVSRLKRAGYPIRWYKKPGEDFKHYYMERPIPAKGTSMKDFGVPKLNII